MALSEANLQKIIAVLPRCGDDQLELLNRLIVDESRTRYRRNRAAKFAENMGKIQEGTKVRLAANMKPKYLSLQTGRVTRLEAGAVAVIALDRGPMGKFRSGTVRCKIDILTVIEENFGLRVVD